MYKIINIHGKMPEIIQLKEVNRNGFKVLKNELEKSIEEGKERMDAELDKLKERNDEQIKGLKEDTNYRERVAAIMKKFDREKDTLDT
jgi:hypothetical protein